MTIKVTLPLRVRSCIAGLLLVVALPASAYDYRFVESPGARIAYTDYGAGVPVILLHGLSGDYERGLGKLGDALSSEFRVIGIDQRGHGRSGKPHELSAYGQPMADDVLRVMEQLHIQKAHVVGHSMGGVVALHLAATHPDRFYSAVTVGNGLFTHGELSLIGWLIKGQFAWWQLKEFVGTGNGELSGVTDREAPVLAARALNALSITEQQAAAMKVPLLAMRGGPKDDPRDTVERLAAVNPAVKMIRVESEDHVSMLSCAAFLSAVREFLEKNSPPSAAR